MADLAFQAVTYERIQASLEPGPVRTSPAPRCAPSTPWRTTSQPDEALIHLIIFGKQRATFRTHPPSVTDTASGGQQSPPGIDNRKALGDDRLAPVRVTPDCRWLTKPAMVTRELRTELAVCWREVANAGGAVGFPFLPTSDDQVRAALEAVVESLDPQLNRLLLASIASEVAGWLLLSGNSSPLTAHWAWVLRVQTALAHRGAGIGRMLMEEAARSAREDPGLEQLHLELRSGLGLEAFYQSLGCEEVGRWSTALRFPEDDRDESSWSLR